jgi:hypothetical protein
VVELIGDDGADGPRLLAGSQSGVPRVVRYIQGQEAHHRKQTFEEELRELLEKHGIDYDPRYLWT